MAFTISVALLAWSWYSGLFYRLPSERVTWLSPFPNFSGLFLSQEARWEVARINLLKISLLAVSPVCFVAALCWGDDCVAGSVGDAISVMVPDVYISDDGGYSWAKMLEGPHYYTILDSGGIIVAIEHSNRPINVIKYAWAQLQPHFLHKGQPGEVFQVTGGELQARI